MIGLSAPGAAAIITVTPNTVAAGVAAAKGGDTLKFVGDFGLTRLSNISWASTVTLNLTHAHFTDTLDLLHVDNVKIYGGSFDVTHGSTYSRAIVAYGGTNVWVDHTSIVGVDGQQGVTFSGTTNAEMSNGTFSGLQVGLGLISVNGGLATRNRFTGATSDGIDIGNSHFVTANYNACSGSAPSAGAHPDCIQLWSLAGYPLQSDIVVTRNTASGATQGFTSFSTGGGGLRLQITYNTVNTSFPQGVACYACIDSTISYNTLSTIDGSQYKTNLNVVGGNGNTVIGNVIHQANLITGRHDASLDASAMFGADTRFLAGVASAPVPEPATWSLLVAGFGLVGAVARRRTPRAAAAGMA